MKKNKTILQSCLQTKIHKKTVTLVREARTPAGGFNVDWRTIVGKIHGTITRQAPIGAVNTKECDARDNIAYEKKREVRPRALSRAQLSPLCPSPSPITLSPSLSRSVATNRDFDPTISRSGVNRPYHTTLSCVALRCNIRLKCAKSSKSAYTPSIYPF